MSPAELGRAASSKFYDVAENAANNAILAAFARVCMVVATMVILPIALTLGWRQLDRIDRMQQNINQIITQQNTMAIQTETLRNTVDERTSDRYTASQATRDWQVQTSRDKAQDDDRGRLERRLDVQDSRIRDLERVR